MDKIPAFFTHSDGYFRPQPLAVSLWSRKALFGPPVCGLLARELERTCLDGEFVPARFNVELHQPVPNTPLTVEARQARDGNRLRTADATLLADGVQVARASVVFLRRSAQPPGAVWTSERRRPIPPLGDPAFSDPTKPLFGSDGDQHGWSTNMADHQNASRKRKWLRRIGVVDGEEPTPFVCAAIVGEQASLVTNWGTAGVGFINTDVSMTLARLPAGYEMGIEADIHISVDGIAACSATLYDGEGPIGICTVSAIANEQRQLDSTTMASIANQGN